MLSFFDVPISEEDTHKHFCAHCGVTREGIQDIVNHLRQSHKERYPLSGYDFMTGGDIIRQQRRDRAAVERFGLFIDSLGGADDFDLECENA